MIEVDYNWGEGSGLLRCPFCSSNYLVPGGIDGRPNVIDPPPRDLIQQHHDGNGQLTVQCPNVQSWQTTTWRLLDTTNDPTSTRQSGTVRVDRNGTAVVTVNGS